MLNPVTVFIKGIGDHTQALFKLNIRLADRGFPFYWKGGRNFDERYRLWPKPRYIGTWRPPFLKIDEIYLSFHPGTAYQVDFVYRDSDRSLSVTEIRDPSN